MTGSAIVTIIHTTDLHNRLDAPVEERLRGLVTSHLGALLLDSGDALRAGNSFFHPLGEPILERMSALGYVAMAMGNREFHIAPSWMSRKLSQARFPVIASNVEARHGAPVPFVPSVIVRAGGVRVGILAVMTPMVRAGTPLGRLSGFRFQEPVEAARAVGAQLRGEADLVVALTHCAGGPSAEVAALAEVDLTLAGHTHEVACDLTPGAIIVRGGSHGRIASVVRVDVATRGVTVETIALRA